MATLLRICDWDTRFENNRTRELKKLAWVPMPNRHDGDGYTELLDHPDGPSHYAAWAVMVQVASRCDPRGTLLRGTGEPHDSVSLARMTSIPREVFEAAIPRLLKAVWLERISSDGQVLTEIPQEGATLGSQEGAASRVRARKEKKGKEEKGKEENRRERKEETSCPAAPNLSVEIHAVFAHYRTYHPRAAPKPSTTSKEWRLIRQRLGEGFGVDDLQAAIDGCHVTPHNLGANERDTKYLGLTLILKDASQITRFIENAAEPPTPRNERERRTLDAAREYLEGIKDGTL